MNEPATPTKIRVLRWPWALAGSSDTVSLEGGHGELPYQGSVLLACSTGMRILPIGGAADLARLGETDEWDLYELPHGRTGSVECALEMQGYAGGEQHRWLVGFNGARVRFEKGPDMELLESAESIAVFDWWDAFDDLLSQGEGVDKAISWSRVERWLGQQSRSNQPRRSLIVEVAERLSSSIDEKARHLRRILLRRRDVIPVGRIQQLDQECLRWYIRQPGESLAEKAGHRQEIMSVVRQETFDTLENRILKDFLIRCIRAANRYSQRFKADYPNSSRILLVQRFARLCQDALQNPHFEEVRRPRPGAQPNYVLQSDPRYRDIWHWYQKLLRNQDSEDQIWNWQSRLWSDVSRLLVGAACHLARPGGNRSGARYSELTNAPFFIHQDSKLGSRLIEGWAPGPLLVQTDGKRPSVLSVIDANQASLHPVTSDLGLTGAHSYLVKEEIGADGSPDVIVVWSINSMATTSELDPSEAAQSASAALKRIQERVPAASGHQARLSGLILSSTLGTLAEVSSFRDNLSDANSEVSIVRVGSDPRCWDGAVLEVAEVLEQWLEN